MLLQYSCVHASCWRDASVHCAAHSNRDCQYPKISRWNAVYPLKYHSGTQGLSQNFHSTLIRDYLIEPIKKMRQLCSDLLVYSSLWFADKDDSDYDVMVCTAQLLHFTVLSYANAYTCPLGTEHTGQEIEKFDFPRRLTYSDPALEALFFRRQSATNLFSQESVIVYGQVSRQCQTMGVLTERRHCWKSCFFDHDHSNKWYLGFVLEDTNYSRQLNDTVTRYLQWRGGSVGFTKT